MTTKIILIVGLPGSGKTTYAEMLLDDDTFLVDDPSRDKHLFDDAVMSGKRTVIVCDPLLINSTVEEATKFLTKKFGEDILIEWVYFENDQEASWANHLKRNETDPRDINKKFHKAMSKKYVIPEGAKVIPVYREMAAG